MGMFAEHGTDVTGHLFRALWELGYLVVTTDYSNGFNAFDRQAMLDAVNRKCPALNAVFNMFYGIDSMCFFRMENETKIIWSKQGSRMGCVLGSFGFNITVDPIYKATARKFTKIVSKALTDDFTNGIPPPENREEMPARWKMCADLLEFIATESKKVAGLELNFSKCHVLAPKNFPDPPPGILPAGVNLERDGLRLAGTPIGTDEFCKQFMDKQVASVAKKMRKLEGMDPQTGYALLRSGIVPTLMFSSQVTPPELAL